MQSGNDACNHGGASLQVLASAIALPLQQLVLTSPLVGVWREDFFWGDGIALALVLGGFGVYQALSPEGRRARGDHGTHAPPAALPAPTEPLCIARHPPEHVVCAAPG